MNQSQTSRFRSSNFYRDVIKHLIKEIIAEAYSLLITLKSPKLSKSENEVLSELKRSGIAKVDGFLSPETCDALAQDLKALLNLDCGVFWEDQHGSDSRIFHMELGSQKAKEFLTDGSIDRVRRAYVGRRKVEALVMANKLSVKQGNLGSGGGWHRDLPFKKQFKVIVYLSDVEKPMDVSNTWRNHIHDIGRLLEFSEGYFCLCVTVTPRMKLIV